MPEDPWLVAPSPLNIAQHPAASFAVTAMEIIVQLHYANMFLGIAASRNGLALCSTVFEVTGARATQSSVGFDCHWRNLRTQSLRDPFDYKLHELGEWALNHPHPFPTFYS